MEISGGTWGYLPFLCEGCVRQASENRLWRCVPGDDRSACRLRPPVETGGGTAVQAEWMYLPAGQICRSRILMHHLSCLSTLEAPLVSERRATFREKLTARRPACRPGADAYIHKLRSTIR